MKGLVAGLWATLAGASFAFGQAPVATPPAPAPVIGSPADGSQSPVPALIPGTGGPTDGQEPSINMQSGLQCGGLFTVGADYVLWFFPEKHETTPVATDGFLTNKVLATASDQQLDRHIWSGFRMTFGYWLTEPSYFVPNAGIRTFGAETKFFFIGERSITVRNDTSPIILRPFFDLNNRIDNAVVVAAPGLATGLIQAQAKMGLWGFESNLWKNLSNNDPYTVCNVMVMAGVRYLEMDPQIEVTSTSVYNTNLAQFPGFQTFAGNRIEVNELFATRNRFFGGQLGVSGVVYFERIIVDGSFKLALGTTHQDVHIEGSQVRTLANGTSVTSPAGVLALASNSGRFSQDKFSQIPEFNIGINCPILSGLNLRFEFMALYWSKILRAREQIDRTIDITQIPNFPAAAGVAPTGLDRPSVPFKQSGLWMLGIALGAEVKW